MSRQEFFTAFKRQDFGDDKKLYFNHDCQNSSIYLGQQTIIYFNLEHAKIYIRLEFQNVATVSKYFNFKINASGIHDIINVQ
jgi:hypothetical protein